MELCTGKRDKRHEMIVVNIYCPLCEAIELIEELENKIYELEHKKD